MLASDVRRRLLSVGTALLLSVPVALAVPGTAQAATDTQTLARTTTTFQVLGRGDTGDRVTRVQRWLEIRRTGYFGKGTISAVTGFQKRRGIDPSGRVNERTWTALQNRWDRIQERYQRVLTVARNQFGDPYVYGAAGPSAFDCSGFTLYVYRQATGRDLPHRATSQYLLSHRIGRAEARPGDLVFFHSGGDIYHAAIYAGRGYVYHVAQPGTVVGRAKIWTSSVYYGRVIGER